jgi:esterase/lipase superfamily enzyme
LERPKRLPPDPRTDFTVTNPVTYETDTGMVAEIRRELAKRPPGDRKVLLFVHGFNNTSTDATLRLTQFVEDTGFKGVPILFTWASAAKASRYVYDLNSTLVAREQVRHIADIMVRTKAESADVFAHSMGTFLTMEGLLDLQQAGTLGRRGEIDHIMLAAPDIDLDVFRTQLRQLAPAIRNKMYVLISKDDKALSLSSKIAGGVPRVGIAHTAELEALGVTVIDLSAIEDSSSGSHSKYAGSPEVVKLIGAGLNSGHNFGQDNTPAIQKILSASPIQIFGNGTRLFD